MVHVAKPVICCQTATKSYSHIWAAWRLRSILAVSDVTEPPRIDHSQVRKCDDQLTTVFLGYSNTSQITGVASRCHNPPPSASHPPTPTSNPPDPPRCIDRLPLSRQRKHAHSTSDMQRAIYTRAHAAFPNDVVNRHRLEIPAGCLFLSLLTAQIRARYRNRR